MTNLIGRLPTTSGDLQPGIGGGDDHELELLERQLFETKSTHHYRSAPNNLFPTYPRKRMGAASLMTLWANRGLLDEGPNEVTKRMLVGVDTRWDFNAFSFDRLTGGQNLATLCTYLFRDLGLLAHFRLDALVVWRFFATVERHYHATNPYHNGVHAADVTQAMACFIAEPALRQHLRPIEKMSAIIAAVGHDLDHPGLNEKFLIATSSHLAGLYNNSSVLENHHWRTCVALMHETGFAGSLNTSDRLECEDLIQTMVLATDISRQSDYLKQLGQYLDQAVLDLSQSVYRHFMLQIALKCADISNPCRTWNISRLWSYRACEEFYRQGDRERELNLPVTPFCDRNNISVAKVQSTFYRYVAAPLFEEWHRSLSSSLSTTMLGNLTSNQARWDLISQQESRSTMAESVVSTSSSSGGGGSFQCESRRDSLEPPAPHNRFSRSSADGDEDSDPCSSYPYVPLDADEHTYGGQCLSPRRHSLPPFLSDPLFRLYTSMTSSTDPSPMLHRQYSLVERRRSSAVQELRKQNSELLANVKLAQRRRLFAANRNRASTDSTTSTEAEANDSSNSFNSQTRVTFHLGSTEANDCGNAADNKRQNTSLLCVASNTGLSQRRGSAPCNLLLNQINKIANSATKAASTASREHSPRGYCYRGHMGRRRGSLPSDLLSLGVARSHSRSSSGGPSRPAMAHGDKAAAKKRKLLRRRSAGSGDNFVALENVGGGPANTSKRRGPSLGKRGSLKSSSFGGVGCGPHVRKPPVKMANDLYNGRLSWHGKTAAASDNNLESVLLNEVHQVHHPRVAAVFRNLSPSVESELLEEIQLNYFNGRRGSLPIDLILC